MGRPATSVDPQSFDGFAVDYDRYASLEPPMVLDWLLAQLPGRGRRALDAGCGSGRHTLALADRFDHVVGVDISEPLIDIARHQRFHPRVTYMVGDLLAITDPDGFDLVVSSTTLHHLPDLDAALHHLRRLVGPGGTAILIDNVASRPTPPGWLYRLGRSAPSPPTCAATAGSRPGGCSSSGRAPPGWSTSPATATSLATRSNSAMVPSSLVPGSMHSATPTP
jgi:SAM-dependent methyltransferase